MESLKRVGASNCTQLKDWEIPKIRLSLVAQPNFKSQHSAAQHSTEQQPRTWGVHIVVQNALDLCHHPVQALHLLHRCVGCAQYTGDEALGRVGAWGSRQWVA